MITYRVTGRRHAGEDRVTLYEGPDHEAANAQYNGRYIVGQYERMWWETMEDGVVVDTKEAWLEDVKPGMLVVEDPDGSSFTLWGEEDES
jgi:hypothetical protein